MSLYCITTSFKKFKHSPNCLNLKKYPFSTTFSYDFKEKDKMATGKVLHSILQSDSQRILREYALRFGVPDSFQRICLLELLVR